MRKILILISAILFFVFPGCADEESTGKDEEASSDSDNNSSVVGDPNDDSNSGSNAEGADKENEGQGTSDSEEDKNEDGNSGGETDNEISDSDDGGSSGEEPGVVSGDFTSVSAGGSQSCALHKDGVLFCWGSNYYGQVGNGATYAEGDEERFQNVPAEIKGTWISVSAGSDHTCGIQEGGKMFCWGRNYWAQLGNGLDDKENKNTPQQIGEDVEWRYVSSGVEHSCALSKSNELYCWGNNSEGVLGTGEYGMHTSSNVPKRAGEDSDWEKVYAGRASTCASKGDGSIYCWGKLFDKWGNPDYSKLSPTIFEKDKKWLDFSKGYDHTCGVSKEGELYCWGNNADWQLGLGQDSAKKVTEVTKVNDEKDWDRISAGDQHTCAVKSNGTLYCWGINTFGQLGTGEVGRDTSKYVPTKIGHDSDWIDVHTGTFHTCALKKSGTVYCWGQNVDGQIGTGGDNNDRPYPEAVFGE